MDFGDIVRLVIFGLIFLSFFSGLFDRGKKDQKKSDQKPAAPRPRELSQSGGQDRQRRPATTRAEPVPVEMDVFTGEGTPRTEARRQELRERFADKLHEQRQMAERPGERLERDIVDTEGRRAERDITDMPSPMDTDPERRARVRRVPTAAARRRHPATGGDVLRRSLKDPDTLERAFIVKEVLDRPLSLRGDR